MSVEGITPAFTLGALVAFGGLCFADASGIWLGGRCGGLGEFAFALYVQGFVFLGGVIDKGGGGKFEDS